MLVLAWDPAAITLLTRRNRHHVHVSRHKSETNMSDVHQPVIATPPHVTATAEAATRIDLTHRENATGAERHIEQLTGCVGQPRFLAGVSVAIMGWIGLNLLAPVVGIPPIDHPPFEGLFAVVALAEFYVVIFILITQRREEALAQHQAQLILELTLLSEQKTSKIIGLLEELRRDSPQIRDRLDEEAVTMTKHVNSEDLVGALKDANALADGKSRRPHGTT